MSLEADAHLLSTLWIKSLILDLSLHVKLKCLLRIFLKNLQKTNN